MLAGNIKAKDVVSNTFTIIKEYGWKCYLTCLWHIFSRKHTTFLEISCCDKCDKEKKDGGT